MKIVIVSRSMEGDDGIEAAIAAFAAELIEAIEKVKHDAI